jgi:DMSO/TMAO reductase YedYZ molybdopterin-dependent catalytic subunit
MKFSYVKLFGLIFMVIMILLSLAILPGCYDNVEKEQNLGKVTSGISAEQPNQETVKTGEEAAGEITGNENGMSSETESSEIFGDFASTSYKLVDGLHVTGKPIEVDIKNYRLKVTGLVEKEVDFSFEDIKAMPKVRVYSILDCPGFFTDEGNWTGVEIKYLLELAGIKEGEAKSLMFSAIDNSYSSGIELNKINQEGFLVAYQFNDKEFIPEHGFPLRIVAKGEPGNHWVKWLGEIKVE